MLYIRRRPWESLLFYDNSPQNPLDTTVSQEDLSPTHTVVVQMLPDKTEVFISGSLVWMEGGRTIGTMWKLLA